jgi:hypothetical protein
MQLSAPAKFALMCLILVLSVASIAAMTRAKSGSLADFGVTGDGVADDTVALQAAVDAKLGSIHFPRGTYRITQPIVVDLDKVGFTSFTSDGTATLRMEGAGPAIRFIGTHLGTADPGSVKPEVWGRQRTPRVEGLEIVGGHEEASGIEASGTMQLTVRGVVIRQCLHGVHLVQRNRNVLISDCHIYENRGCGVFLDRVNLHQTNIIGCHISYCDQGGVVTRGGEVRNLHIGTCDIESCQSPNSEPTANVLIDCSKGSTAEVAIVGCTIQHNSKSPESANIRVIGGGSAIRAADGKAKWGHVTIGDNVLSDVRVNIDLVDCRGVALTNNTFWMGYDYNLRMTGCEQVVVGPNLFERNPAYDYDDSKTTKNAVLIKDCRDLTLTGLHLQGVHGDDAALVLDTCQRVHLFGCTILDSPGVGLLVKDCQHSRIGEVLVMRGEETPEDGIKVTP